MELNTDATGTAQKIAFGTGFIIASRLVSKVLGLISIFLLARYLGVDNFGNYSLVITFVSFFLFMNDLGVSAVFIRGISSEKSTQDAGVLLGDATSLKLLLSFIAIAGTIVFAFVFSYPYEIILLIAIFSATHLFGSLTTIYTGFLQARMKMFEVALLELFLYVFYLVSLLAVIFLGKGLQELLFLYVISTAITMFLAWFYSRKHISVKFRINLNAWKQLLNEGWPFAMTSLFIALYNRVDILMLSKMATAADIGKYSASFRLTEALAIIPGALSLVLFPVMSKYHKESKEVLISIHRFAFKYLAYLFVPIAFGATFLSSRIIFWIYGNEFLGTDTYASLAILSWSALFLFMNLISMNLLNAMFMEKKTMSIILFGIFFNVALNFLLIPKYGFVGAAFTTLLTEIALFFIFIYMIFRSVYKVQLTVFIRPLVSGVIMGVAVVNLAFLNIIPLIALGAVVYFAALFALGGFGKEDYEIFSKVTGQLKNYFSKKAEQ